MMRQHRYLDAHFIPQWQIGHVGKYHLLLSTFDPAERETRLDKYIFQQASNDPKEYEDQLIDLTK